MKLADGTVIPSSFSATGRSQYAHGFEHVRKSERLKVGTIVAVRTVDTTEGLQKSAANSSQGVEGTPYETTYDVRVDDQNARPFIFTGCRALKPFFGANNYFDMIHESAELNTLYSESGIPGVGGGVFDAPTNSLVGSRCVILCVEGEPTAPVILGFLQHQARPSKIKKDKGLHMEFEFNGIKVEIDKDGAFKLEGSGPFIPIVAPPAAPVPESVVRANPLIGPFTVQLDKDMVFSVFDNLGQTIKIDRSAHQIEITNGTESITMIGSLIPKQGEMLINVGGALTIACTDAAFGADKSFELSTLMMTLNADTQLEIKTGNFTSKMEFGFSVESLTTSFKTQLAFAAEATTFSFKGPAGELLALIYEIVDGLSKITVASPVGPCAPILAAPQWAPVMAALVKLKTITG